VNTRPGSIRALPAGRRSTSPQLTQLLDAGRRGDAMELFMRTVGLPAEMIAGMRHTPT
jgi:hypothetical protein